MSDSISRTVTDILLVKQKLFENYPENSYARKMLFKKQQMQELSSLTLTDTFLYPKEYTDNLVSKVKREARIRTILASALLFLILLSIKERLVFFSGMPFFYFFCLGTLSFIFGLHLAAIFQGVKAILKVKRARLALQKKIKALSDDVFNI